ncbi:hypothetical protein LCGC14_1818430 [marine sediment metagenome]|uniref:Uncharacterized protein n=1 Tax=marine sediment metagenome TaxID=412755 RepID=A0A0F9GJQ4_9ZZZZ
MRVLLRIDADPPENGKPGGYFAVMLGRLREWLASEYPEWNVNATTVVGFEDSLEEARHNLSEQWTIEP